MQQSLDCLNLDPRNSLLLPNVEWCVFIVLSRRNGSIELSKGNNLISIWCQLQWPGLLLIAAQWLATVVLTTVTESPLVKLTVRNMRCWQKPQENTPISLYIVDVCRRQTLGTTNNFMKLPSRIHLWIIFFFYLIAH